MRRDNYGLCSITLLQHGVAFGLICLTPVSVWGQIQDLATTDDGSKLFFSSTLRLKGTDEFDNGKIFEYSNGTFALLGQVIPSTTLRDGSVFQFALRVPNTDAGGDTVFYEGTASCTGGPSCAGAWTTASYSIREKLPAIAMGYGAWRISHNGRYALRVGGEPATLTPSVVLYDLQSGPSVETLLCNHMFCQIPGDARQAIADDGTVLTSQGLWRGGQLKRLNVSHYEVASRLSPDGSMVVYESADQTDCFGDLAFGSCTFNNQLYAYDVARGVEVHLAAGPSYRQNYRAAVLPYFFPSLSSDGRLVLLRGASSQLILAATDGSAQRQLTNDLSGIAEGILSGNAHRAYAVTKDGTLLSIDIDSGQVQTLFPGRVPAVTAVTGAAVPGSLVTLTGVNLSTSDGHSRLTFRPHPTPILASSQNSVTFQVPWELDLTETLTISGADPDSPFEQATALQPTIAAPRFLGVFHSDFTPIDNWTGFAKPGEMIILQMTGLGPINPSVATGQTAPLNSLSRVQLALNCLWGGIAQPADVQFAGLEPGMVGIYQANIVAPGLRPGDSADAYSLTCAAILPSGERSASATTGILVSNGH